MNFTYKSEEIEKAVLFYLKGNLLDKDSALPLLDEVDKFIEREKNKFIVDLAEMNTLNSSGINVLITLFTKARNSGGDAIIINVPNKINTLLVITKLNTIFTIKEDKKAALDELAEV